MKTPVHRYKTFVRYADNSKSSYWSYDGRLCWLGSGIEDKHGKEIFEGDIVKLRDGKTYPVIFAQGNFTIDTASLVLFEHACEVVGHVEEED